MTFEEYVHRRLPDLVRIARSICRDRQLGEDLVQDVLMKLHARWATVEELDHLDAYVRRMLVNEFLSWRRKWSRYVPQADPAQHLVDDAGDHAQTVVERDALLGEIANLPDRQRVVIVLRYLADLPDADIADALGCRQSTVRVHASRALTALRVSPLRPRPTPALGGNS